MSLGVLDRITRNVVLNPDTGCIEWAGPDNGGGYGRLHLGGKLIYTHRLSYELAFGAIPEGLVIDHLCRNPPCLRPDHLEAVTHAENARRGSKGLQTACVKGGHPFDEANTYITPAGARACRTCKRLNEVRYRAQRKAARTCPSET